MSSNDNNVQKCFAIIILTLFRYKYSANAFTNSWITESFCSKNTNSNQTIEKWCFASDLCLAFNRIAYCFLSLETTPLLLHFKRLSHFMATKSIIQFIPVIIRPTIKCKSPLILIWFMTNIENQFISRFIRYLLRPNNRGKHKNKCFESNSTTNKSQFFCITLKASRSRAIVSHLILNFRHRSRIASKSRCAVGVVRQVRSTCMPGLIERVTVRVWTPDHCPLPHGLTKCHITVQQANRYQ